MKIDYKHSKNTQVGQRLLLPFPNASFENSTTILVIFVRLNIPFDMDVGKSPLHTSLQIPIAGRSQKLIITSNMKAAEKCNVSLKPLLEFPIPNNIYSVPRTLFEMGFKVFKEYSILCGV